MTRLRLEEFRTEADEDLTLVNVGLAFAVFVLFLLAIFTAIVVLAPCGAWAGDVCR